jgi:hypothetical protein
MPKHHFRANSFKWYRGVRRGIAARATLSVLGITGASVVLASCSNSMSTDSKSPGLIALTYLGDVIDGHTVQAEKLVSPSQRATFRLVAAQIKPGSVKASDLKVGSVRKVGSKAYVILTGRLCNANATGVQGSEYCVSNSNPRSKNPAFEVKLSRSSSGAYYVIFQQ